jgi:hypothetical protein
MSGNIWSWFVIATGGLAVERGGHPHWRTRAGASHAANIVAVGGLIL